MDGMMWWMAGIIIWCALNALIVFAIPRKADIYRDYD
jgi:hypothetical protein